MSARQPFRPARFQDASAVIRGFRYQIDHTILRWLELSADEHLELECGEDIDLVANALTNSCPEGFDRRLEQIKLRTAKLSLRSESALEVLANAVGHFLQNSSIRLRFCYTTNAISTRERPCPFPNRLSGIELWSQLNSATLPADQVSPGVQSLRQFLISASRPKKASSATWLQFSEYVRSSSESDFLSFIQSFEWSCCALAIIELTDRVRDELRGRINDAKFQLDAIYDRIFLYVFRLLTQPAQKRLTRACLETQLASETISAADRLVLAQLQRQFAILDDRVGDLEQSMSGVSESVTSLGVQQKKLAREFETAIRQQADVIHHATSEFKDQVARLAHQQGIHVERIDPVGFVTVGNPPLVAALARRTETVAGLLKVAVDRIWLAIYGLSDTGKTHLAALIAGGKGTCRGWLRFHFSMSQSQALATLHEALRQISGLRDNAEGVVSALWYDHVCAELGSGSCLVLDDLPNLVLAPALTQQLQFLAEACSARNVLLVSTSHFRLPSNVVSVFGERCVDVPVPRFSELEARDVLASHGAPDTFLTDRVVKFISDLSSGHPLLLTLAAKFLKDRNWKLDDPEFSHLLRGDHSIRIADDVLLRVCESMDTSQRELLYRMTLAIGHIEDANVVQLAGVEVAIERPRETLVGLIGAWVQRDTDQHLIVSPLVKSLGGQNLAPKTFVGCHALLGEIVVKRTMTPWDAEIAVIHFLQARQFDRAGVLWLTLLDQFRTRKIIPELRSVLSLWYELPMPIELSLDLRVMIRAMQFWVLPKYQIPLEPVLRDLDRLMEQIGPSNVHSAQIVGSLASLFLSSHDFVRATRFLTLSIAALRNTDLNGIECLRPEGKTQVELLWTLIVNIQNQTHLTVWLEAFDSLTPDEKVNVIESSDASLGCCVLADRLMLVEMSLPPAKQQWNRVLKETIGLQKAAKQRGWGHLEAAARKAVVNIHGEFLKTPEKCIDEVREFVRRQGPTAADKGLVSGMLGKMLAGAGKHKPAMHWLRIAIGSPDAGLPHDRMMTFLAAAKSVSKENPEEAIQYSEAAARIAGDGEDISDIEAVKAYGEWAIALAGTAKTMEAALRAFPAWKEAANRLFRIPVRDDSWKEVAVVFGHTTSYFTCLAGSGSAPDSAADGSEFAAPFQGFFFTSHPERKALYRDDFACTMWWLLSKYAWKAGDEAAATVWMKLAGDEIDGRPLNYITATITRDLVPDFLRASKFDDAMSVTLRGTQVMVACKEIASKRAGAIDPSTPLDAIVEEMSPDSQRLAERFALIEGVIPTLLHVMKQMLEDRDVGVDFARQVASLCRQTAVAACDPKFWTGSAEVFDAIAKGANDREFLKLSNSFTEDEYAELRVLGYLASATAGNAESAFQAQLACIQKIMSWYPVDGPNYSQLLLPFCEAFWAVTFQRSRFQFRSPALIESQLKDAIRSPPASRLVAIFVALLPAFETGGFQESVEFLRNKQDA